MKNNIELKQICKSFHQKTVLNNITLHVEQGEIVGLLGPSGAGKTTLINIITGQLLPDKGTILFDGMEMKKRDLSSVGIMMDDMGLYERLSVYDNLSFYARLYQVNKKRINHVLDGAGLADAKKIPVHKLSKGMRNRVNFCRAILKDIHMLFLDEPTAGLDPTTMKEIHRLILSQKEKGTTILLTTHNMYEAQSLCDHIALLHQGTIIEYGTPEEICNRYNHLNQIIVVRKNGETITLNNDKSCLPQLTALIENEDISTIHSTEPDLEKVFLESTTPVAGSRVCEPKS